MFPRKIIDDRAHVLSCRGQTDEGLRSIEVGGGLGSEEKHVTNPPMTQVPRCSSTLVIQSKQSITHLLSRPCGHVCVYVCVCMVYSCCLMAHEDFVVCQLRHLQRAFGRHANTHASRIVRKGIVLLYVVDLGVVKSTGCSEC